MLPGWKVGTRLMKRLWRLEGLLVPQKRRKRRRLGTSEAGIVRRKAIMKNEVWGMDFIHDHTSDGRTLKMLVVVDEYTRECLALDVGRTCRGGDVVAVLDELTAIRGAPQNVRSDNGPEFISEALKRWCTEGGTGTLDIEPGAPWQNGIVESFNGRLRDALLAMEMFDTLAETKYLVDRWRLHDNHRRPQRALGRRTPAEYAATCPGVSPLRLAALRPPRTPPTPLPCTNSHNGWTDESDPVRVPRFQPGAASATRSW